MTKTRTILLDILGLAVVAVIVIAVWVGYKKHPTTQPVKPVTGVRIDAPKSKVVQNFPKDLILDPKASIVESYSLTYPNAFQNTLSEKSSLSQMDLFKLYQTYMIKNGYTITNASNRYVPVYQLYGTKNGNTLSVSIAQDRDGKNTDLLISYTLPN